AMNGDMIPGVALRAVLFEGAGNSSGSWLTAALHHSKQLNWLIATFHAGRESCGEDTFARATLKFFRHRHALHCLLPVPPQNLTHGRNHGGLRPMSGWNHQACS